MKFSRDARTEMSSTRSRRRLHDKQLLHSKDSRSEKHRDKTSILSSPSVRRKTMVQSSEDTSNADMLVQPQTHTDNIRRSARARKTKSALELLGLKIKKEKIDPAYEAAAKYASPKLSRGQDLIKSTKSTQQIEHFGYDLGNVKSESVKALNNRSSREFKRKNLGSNQSEKNDLFNIDMVQLEAASAEEVKELTKYQAISRESEHSFEKLVDICTKENKQDVEDMTAREKEATEKIENINPQDQNTRCHDGIPQPVAVVDIIVEKIGDKSESSIKMMKIITNKNGKVAVANLNSMQSIPSSKNAPVCEKSARIVHLVPGVDWSFSPMQTLESSLPVEHPSKINVIFEHEIKKENSEGSYRGDEVIIHHMNEEIVETENVSENLILEEINVTPDNAAEDVVIMSGDIGESDDTQITQEALIKLASEVAKLGCDDNSIYRIELDNGVVSHFMIKHSAQDPVIVEPMKKKTKKTGNKSATLVAPPVTSEEIEIQDVLFGKTEKGRSHPQRQLVVKKELQELVDNLEPSDFMEEHVVQVLPGPGDKEFVPSGHYSSRYKSKSKQIKCKYCSHIILDRHNFRKHIRTHPEIEYKPYACPLCDYKANIKAAVVRHINIHSEVMPYICTKCGRGFNFKQKLLTHLRYHNDVRDYQCPNCPLAFHEHKTMKNHIRSIHGNQKPIPSGEEAKAMRNFVSTNLNNQYQKIKDKIEEVKQLKNKECPEEHKSVQTSHLVESPRKDFETTPSSKDSIPEDPSHSVPLRSTGSELAVSSISIPSSEQKVKLSKYVGTNKIKLVTNRFREGLTKFGASHDEITASFTWKSRKPIRKPKQLPTDIRPPAQTVMKSEDSTQEADMQTAVALIENCVKTESGDNLTEGYDIVSVTTIQDPHNSLGDEEAMDVFDDTTLSENPKENFTINIVPLKDSEPTTKTEPIVSNKNLTSTFDAVCETTYCQNDKEEWYTYTCRKCDLVSVTKTLMVEHIQRDHHDVKLWECNLCDYKCRLRSSIFVHLKIHEGNKKYECEVCSKSYTLLSKLRQHMLTHSDILAYKCEHCDKTFKRKHDLKKHNDRIHSQDRPFRCEVCDKSFKDRIQVKRHMDTHVEGKHLLCQVCNKYYKNKSSLQQHLKSHNCRFYCELCNKAFGSYSGFMAHKVMHTESFEGFHCDLCGKILHTKGSLNRHLTISHSTARPFACTECKSSFKTKKDLRNHAIVHSSSKNFACSVCSFKSKRYESLQVHQRRHQDIKPFRCGICSREYTQKRSLQLHLQYHLSHLNALKCQICKKRFTDSAQLNNHMESLHNEPVPSDGGLVDVKTGTTFYMCEDCNCVFLSQDKLAVHILMQHINQPYEVKVQMKSDDDVNMELAAETLKENHGDEFSVLSFADLLDKSSADNNSVAQYVAITDPKSKQKRVVTVMHPISQETSSDNVEVEGEVVMNISDALVESDASGVNSDNYSESHNMLLDSNETVVSHSADTVSMTFTIPKESHYPHPDSQSVVSFMDPHTNEEFTVSMPQQTLVNLLTPVSETEVISSLSVHQLDDHEIDSDNIVSIPEDSVSGYEPIEMVQVIEASEVTFP